MTDFLHKIKWIAVLLVIFALAGFIYIAVKIGQPQATNGQEKMFTVHVGATTKQIASSLEKEGFIGRAFFFETYVFLKNQGRKIQAGDYQLSSKMSIREIAAAVTSGRVVNNQVKFTVIEGWTIADIGETLHEAGVIPGKSLDFAPSEFIDDFPYLADQAPGFASLEGYLFPDTYFIAKDGRGEDLVKKALANFDRKLSPEIRKNLEKQGRTIRQTVILASIIEKEVGRNLKKGTKLSDADVKKLAEERRLVASVFYNRLAIGKALESDATVSYITGSKSNRATIEETKIDNPYNTYKYPGLPPGPISNPSLDSLAAAGAPAETDYMYFVTSADGTAYFAKTLEEHGENRQKYLN